MSHEKAATYRGYLVDHHSPAPPVVTFDKLKVEEYRDFLRTAKVNSLMLYCKDHWGYSYYETKIGTKHPGLKQDWVAVVSRMLREEQIEFNAYYCLEYDTLAPQQHPEWSIVNAKGQTVRLEGRMAKWGMPCYETEYRGYVLGQLQEIVEKYEPDSLFLDIFGKSLCYCDACRDKFHRLFGYTMPEAGSENKNEYNEIDFGAAGKDINHFLEDCAVQMLIDIKTCMKAIDPNLQITINFAALYPKRIRDMLDYHFTEPWAGNWLSAGYSRDTAGDVTPQLGPGDVSEVYNYKPETIYQLAVAQLAAAGCRVFLYSGSQHVDGTLEHEEARRIGAAYDAIEKMEPWLTGRTLYADVAILQSESSSQAMSGSKVIANAIGRCKRTDVHREALLGAMRCCDAACLTYAVVPEQDATIERLRRYQMVILAGVSTVDEAMVKTLTAYVSQGGSVLMDGISGLYDEQGDLRKSWPLSSLTGGVFKRLLDQYSAAAWGAYIEPDDHTIWQQAPRTFMPTGPVQFEVEARTAKPAGKLRMPAVALTEKTWVNWWCPPPAADTTDYPALLENKIGKGQIVYLACEFFRDRCRGLELAQSVFNGLVQYLMPDPVIKIETKMPETLGMVAYRRDNELIIHQISHLAEKTGGETAPLPGGILKIHNGKMKVVKASVVFPKTDDLAIVRGGQYDTIALPPVDIHQLIVIQLDG